MIEVLILLAVLRIAGYIILIFWGIGLFICIVNIVSHIVKDMCYGIVNRIWYERLIGILSNMLMRLKLNH